MLGRNSPRGRGQSNVPGDLRRRDEEETRKKREKYFRELREDIEKRDQSSEQIEQ